MYHHVKKLMYTVRIGTPDPRFGRILLEQFGGANGELAASMQYSIQGLNTDDAGLKDLLMDIGTEELSHADMRGPWNQGNDIEYIESPVKMEAQVTQQEIEREMKQAAR